MTTSWGVLAIAYFGCRLGCQILGHTKIEKKNMHNNNIEYCNRVYFLTVLQSFLSIHFNNTYAQSVEW